MDLIESLRQIRLSHKNGHEEARIWLETRAKLNADALLAEEEESATSPKPKSKSSKKKKDRRTKGHTAGVHWRVERCAPVSRGGTDDRHLLCGRKHGLVGACTQRRWQYHWSPQRTRIVHRRRHHLHRVLFQRQVAHCRSLFPSVCVWTLLRKDE